MTRETLEKRVAAVNGCHRLLNELQIQYHPWLCGILGAKLYLADGSMSKKLVPPTMVNTANKRCWLEHTYGSLWVHASLSYQTSAVTCDYYKNSKLLAHLESGVVSKVADLVMLKEDYRLKEVEEAKKEHRRLKEQADSIRNEFYPFSLD